MGRYEEILDKKPESIPCPCTLDMIPKLLPKPDTSLFDSGGFKPGETVLFAAVREPLPANMTFHTVHGEVLRIQEDGFYVYGKKVPEDEELTSEVFFAFCQFLNGSDVVLSEQLKKRMKEREFLLGLNKLEKEKASMKRKSRYDLIKE